MLDPDLEMVGEVGGGGEMGGGLFGLKIRGGASPLGTSPGFATGGDAPLRNGGRGVRTPCTPSPRSAPRLYAQSHMTSFSC